MIDRVYTKVSEKLLERTNQILGSMHYLKVKSDNTIVINLLDRDSPHWYTYHNPSITNKKVYITNDEFNYLLDLIEFGFTFNDNVIINFLNQIKQEQLK